MNNVLYFWLLVPWIFFSCSAPEPAKMPPITVPVYEVTPQDIVIKKDFVGQAYGNNDIDIRARVSGFLEAINFIEGSRVNKGDLLYEIDPQPFQEKVAQQQGLLAQAKTQLSKADSDLKRIRPLAESNAVSQRDLDAAVAAYESAQAEVEAAEAAVRLARIELGYTRIEAPISGIIGKSEAEISDYVGQYPNPVILNTVSETENIRVEFFITESQYINLIRSRQQVAKEPNEQLPLELVLSDGSVHPYTGRVDFLNRQIDRSTGTILLQATFPNPEQVLRPGQSVIVRAAIYTLKNGIIVPQRAVNELQGLYSVSVFKDDKTIENRKVEVGEKKGNMWVISEGLTAGDKIVLENVSTRGLSVELVPELTEFQVIE
jgi:membrane fusion protein, multidrug efflux system